MKVPPHLRLAFYACVCYNVWTKDGTAWAEGGRDEIDLDFESILELEELYLIRVHPPEFSVGRVGHARVSPTNMGDATTWRDTVTDEIRPQHPGFY